MEYSCDWRDSWFSYLRRFLPPFRWRREGRGAQWSVDAGEWHESGETVTLYLGPHTVWFKDIEQDSGGCFKKPALWNTPSEQTVMIVAGQTVGRTGTYTPSEKSLSAGIPERGSTGNMFTAAILVASLVGAGRRRKKSG